jgi:hypothetical protein
MLWQGWCPYCKSHRIARTPQRLAAAALFGRLASPQSSNLQNVLASAPGLENRTGYTASLTDDQLKKQLAARPTTYLLGELDVLPLGGS